MNPVNTLTGKQVTLRVFQIEDYSKLKCIKPSSEFFHLVGENEADSNFTSEEKLFTSLQELDRNPNFWFIFSNDEIIGNAFFHDFDMVKQSAKIAIGIFEKQNWGKSLGTESLLLLVNHGFNSLALETIYLTVLEYNVRAIRCYEKCGFKQISRIVGSYYIDGECFDDIIMSLDKLEYQKN